MIPVLSFRRVGLLMGVALLFTPGVCRADEPSAKPPPEAAPTGDSRWEVHASVRFRPEFRNNLDFQPTDDFDGFWGQQVRLGLRLRLHPSASAYLQVQDVHAWGAARDEVIYQFNTNVRQFYLDWAPRERFRLRLGRQELLYGNQRLVGPFGWDTVGRTFDGARVRLQWSSRWATDAFAARLVEVRRGGGHRVGNQDLYGLYTRFTPKRAERLELYALYLRDGQRRRGELPTGTPALTRVTTFGARLFRAATSGFHYDFEHAFQVGQRGDDRHRAAALATEAGYSFRRRFSPGVAFAYAFASGDNDPADGRSGEFHNLFPTNHPLYGHADLLGWRNMHDFRARFAAQLHAKLRVQADYHRFLLARRRGRWSNAGGRTLGFASAGTVGRDLGQEVDLVARVRVNKYLRFEAGYAVFVPGTFARATRGGELHHWGYIQTWVGF
ncbi:MAG: alginate export family protein [Terriglobia bacterium]